VAEVIKTADCYIWRETAPATHAGYVELLYLFYAMVASLPPNKWTIRVPPEINLVKDIERDLQWYECRFRLASIASYYDWSKQTCE